jgi:hypothetical protein
MAVQAAGTINDNVLQEVSKNSSGLLYHHNAGERNRWRTGIKPYDLQITIFDRCETGRSNSEVIK